MMETFYRQEFTISDIHVDRFGRVKPSVLLYFIQEAAGAHCSLLAVDHEHLAPKHLFWAVTRNRVQIKLMISFLCSPSESWQSNQISNRYPIRTVCGLFRTKCP